MRLSRSCSWPPSARGGARSLLALTLLLCGCTDGEIVPGGTPDPDPDPDPEPCATGSEPGCEPELPCLDSLSVRQLAGQLVIVLTREPSEVFGLADAGLIAGIGLYGKTGGYTSALTTEATTLRARHVFVAADEEGGRVQRLEALCGPLPAAQTVAETYTLADAQTLYLAHGTKVAATGVDVGFAPVLDVGHGVGITDRSFSSDPATVVDYGLAMADGYMGGGLGVVVKHFPGHGSSDGDSHLGLPTTDPWSVMRDRDVLVFDQVLAQIEAHRSAVMVAHLNVPGFSEVSGVPTSLDPATYAVLRNELGFDGLVMTDALDMDAIEDRFGETEAALMALEAGADMMMLSNPTPVLPVLDAVEAAVVDGRISRARLEQSVQRSRLFRGLPECTDRP